MTHALQNIPKKIASNYLELSNRRQEIATDPGVLSKVTQNEALILVAGGGLAIASMTIDEFEVNMVKTLKAIARDVGVTYWDDALKMQDRFDSIMKFAARFYRDMSTQDIRTAFDLALAGALDDFLPKDRDGHPDIKHYNEFGKDYFAKIMKAYRQLKTSTWYKANKLIPEEVTGVTEDQKSEYRATFIQLIRDKFKEYRDFDVRPVFSVSSLVLKEFKKAGVIGGEINLTHEDISNGFIRMTQDKNINRHQKVRDAKVYEKGDIPDSVETKAISVRYENLIIEIFDKMIEDGLEIDDIINE